MLKVPGAFVGSGQCVSRRVGPIRTCCRTRTFQEKSDFVRVYLDSLTAQQVQHKLLQSSCLHCVFPVDWAATAQASWPWRQRGGGGRGRGDISMQCPNANCSRLSYLSLSHACIYKCDVPTSTQLICTSSYRFLLPWFLSFFSVFLYGRTGRCSFCLQYARKKTHVRAKGLKLTWSSRCFSHIRCPQVLYE